jgi:hypothetical protein
MISNQKKYFLIYGFIFLGILWLILNVTSHAEFVSVCYIKNIWGIPCPSCGTTRAILALLGGSILESIRINPLGIFILTTLIILPFWGVYDLIRNKITLVQFANKTEISLRKIKYAFPLICLLAGNWIWNIIKDI